jgi:hypothetical protein
MGCIKNNLPDPYKEDTILSLNKNQLDNQHKTNSLNFTYAYILDLR